MAGIMRFRMGGRAWTSADHVGDPTVVPPPIVSNPSDAGVVLPQFGDVSGIPDSRESIRDIVDGFGVDFGGGGDWTDIDDEVTQGDLLGLAPGSDVSFVTPNAPAEPKAPEPTAPDEPWTQTPVVTIVVPGLMGGGTITSRFEDPNGQSRTFWIDTSVDDAGNVTEQKKRYVPNPEADYRPSRRGVRIVSNDPARAGSSTRPWGAIDGPDMSGIGGNGIAVARPHGFVAPRPEDSGFFDPTFDQDWSKGFVGQVAQGRPRSAVDESGMAGTNDGARTPKGGLFDPTGGILHGDDPRKR